VYVLFKLPQGIPEATEFVGARAWFHPASFLWYGGAPARPARIWYEVMEFH